MFEDYTYERLLEDVLNNAPEGIDTRQGSIFYDAVSGVLLKVAKLYTDLDLIVEMTTVATATGDALDTRAAEYGVHRLAATRAKYRAIFDGTTPEPGERFITTGPTSHSSSTRRRGFITSRRRYPERAGTASTREPRQSR